MKIKFRREFKSGDKKLQYRTGDNEFKGEGMDWYYANEYDAQSNAEKLRKKGYNVRVWSHVLYKIKGKRYKEYVLYRRKKKQTK